MKLSDHGNELGWKSSKERNIDERQAPCLKEVTVCCVCFYLLLWASFSQTNSNTNKNKFKRQLKKKNYVNLDRQRLVTLI